MEGEKKMTDPEYEVVLAFEARDELQEDRNDAEEKLELWLATQDSLDPNECPRIRKRVRDSVRDWCPSPARLPPLRLRDSVHAPRTPPDSIHQEPFGRAG